MNKTSMVFGSILMFFNSNPSVSMEKNFSDIAWKEIESIYERIEKHPFNSKLSEGTLDVSKFEFYKNQDAYYLKKFSKALSSLATKLDNVSDIKFILRMAGQSFDEDLNDAHIGLEGVTPSNFSYTHFLLSTAAFGSKEELIAAILPCYWIYLKLAKEISKKSDKKNPFSSWIKFYSSTEYQKDVEKMVELTNKLAKQSNTLVRKKMLVAFKAASLLELKFWDDSYNKNEFLSQ